MANALEAKREQWISELTKYIDNNSGLLTAYEVYRYKFLASPINFDVTGYEYNGNKYSYDEPTPYIPSIISITRNTIVSIELGHNNSIVCCTYSINPDHCGPCIFQRPYRRMQSSDTEQTGYYIKFNDQGYAISVSQYQLAV